MHLDVDRRDCPEGKKFWHWIVQMKAYCHLTENHPREAACVLRQR